MNRWPLWLLACLLQCGCHAAGRPPAPMSYEPCPSPGPCDDPDQDAWFPPGPFRGSTATLADNQRLIPGCPATLQVMARPHPIVFQAVTPEAEPDTDPDPADLVCDPREAPLLRAEGQRLDHDLATR
jgi:hypothetical protein